jgi:hypothetical protein
MMALYLQGITASSSITIKGKQQLLRYGNALDDSHYTRRPDLHFVMLINRDLCITAGTQVKIIFSKGTHAFPLEDQKAFMEFIMRPFLNLRSADNQSLGYAIFVS